VRDHDCAVNHAHRPWDALPKHAACWQHTNGGIPDNPRNCSAIRSPPTASTADSAPCRGVSTPARDPSQQPPRLLMQPNMQPNGGKTWRSAGQPADDRSEFELAGDTQTLRGAGWDKAWTVFKTVARPASWSRVGSTPMHLRHILISGNAHFERIPSVTFTPKFVIYQCHAAEQVTRQPFDGGFSQSRKCLDQLNS